MYLVDNLAFLTEQEAHCATNDLEQLAQQCSWR